MHAWESIQKTLDYMEDHIGEDLRIEQLAEMASLSVFYYQRLFSRLVKKPVREYIKLRRLAGASAMLGDKRKRLLDIALDFGFESHETFTRAFKEAYGMTPAQYRNRPVALNQFDKPDLLLGYVLIDEGVPLISDGLVLEMNRKELREPALFMGLEDYVPIPGQIPVGETTGIDVPGELWKRFHLEKNRIPGFPTDGKSGLPTWETRPAAASLTLPEPKWLPAKRTNLSGSGNSPHGRMSCAALRPKTSKRSRPSRSTKRSGTAVFGFRTTT